MAAASGWLLLAALLGLLLGAGAACGILIAVRRREAAGEREELDGRFSAVSRQALTEAMEQFLRLAQSRFQTETERQRAELEKSRLSVETTVSALNERLKAYEEMLRALEKDREQKYGSLDEQLRAVRTGSERLQATTEGLRALLSNSRTRGQWGEWMAEDVLRLCGLQEGIQYLRNKAQETASTRPDYTFLLPQGRKVHMDVKFPLDNYMRMVNAQGSEERARLRKDFVADARARVREVTKRDYVNPEEGTLDFMLLFIPNEQVFGFLQEAAPELFGEALRQKVLLCAPANLFALLSVVRRAHDNFHFAEATQEVVRLIQSFRRDYDNFRARFSRVGELLEKVREAYDEVAQTSHKRLEAAVQRIDRVSQGREAAAEAPPPASGGLPAP